MTATDRDENKTIALSTSKLNYSDPRISVAWSAFFLYYVNDLTQNKLYLIDTHLYKTHIRIIVLLYYRCKKYDVPLEKVYNKTQREKFRWAIDMADEDYRFIEPDDD